MTIPLTTPRTALSQYEAQQRIAVITAMAARRLALRVGPNFDTGWQNVRGRVVQTLQLGRAATVNAAYHYTSDVLAETGQVGSPVGVLQPAPFLALTPSGATVAESVDAFPVKAKMAIAAGATQSKAIEQASSWLTGTVLTMLADTRRDVYQADMMQRPTITGYVRMLNPPSCGRCAVLAGKWFRWNQGFLRHPNCDCIHIPASEQVAGDLTTDPYAYFNSLSEKEQSQVFGKYQAQAVRDGGDIYQVVNSRRAGLKAVGAEQVAYKGGTRRTLASIYDRDRDRRFVVENLRHHGYITGPQVAGGNIRGNLPTDAKVLAAGRGRGTYTVGGQTATTKRASAYDAALSGTRDPLNRATMTAAERRLYDANYRATWARTGYRPNTIGANSADRGLGLRPIVADEAARVEEALRKQAAQMTAVGKSGRYVQPDSFRELGRLLGL